MTRFLAILALAVLIPSCSLPGSSSGGSKNGSSGPVANPDQITLDISNEDAIPYNLSVWEFSGSSTQIWICRPIAGQSGPTPTFHEGVIDFNADSAMVTHSVVLYDASTGATLDSPAFVKGSGQLLLVITIKGGKMSVQAS